MSVLNPTETEVHLQAATVVDSTIAVTEEQEASLAETIPAHRVLSVTQVAMMN